MNKFYGISLKSMQEKATKSIGDAQRIGKAIINNTIDDIGFIFNSAEECLKELDKVRLRATHRAIEYHTFYRRTMIDLGIIPKELIDEVWRRVFGDVGEGDANPRLFHLTNPYTAVWEDPSKRIMKEINISDLTFPTGRAPFIFVHGAGYRGQENEAFAFYHSFEKEAKMFNNTVKDYSNADIYIVSYDSLITNNSRIIIKNAFESILGPVSDDDAPLLFSAVMWRVWEKRAEVTAQDVILPFMKKISESGIEAPSLGAGAITHSLGCYAMAYAAQLFIQEISEPALRPFKFWFCMAAALPANAFTNTGDFPLAPRIAGPAVNGPEYGTSVWFSNFDLILGGLYTLLANQHFAMGETGALVSAHGLTNLDVTMCTNEVHNDFEYFPLVKHEIRSALGTELWSEQPRCALTLPNIIESIN
ncbi:hypothetical protein [Bacillus cereus]|uniref:hypothetical protein n=1 Tax=Bacillus cereus TaxID=1396 RepID=UPI0005CF8A02|nr:hypothetical protein [Bacillus cereus]